MRVIIAGCRDLFDPQLVEDAVKASGFAITEVVSGCADGIDTVGATWAKERGIPVKEFPPETDVYEFAVACRLRNREMALYGQALIAVWDGVSRGTGNMIGEARAEGLKWYIHRVAKK